MILRSFLPRLLCTCFAGFTVGCGGGGPSISDLAQGTPAAPTSPSGSAGSSSGSGSGSTGSSSPVSTFCGGNGTAANPYLICTEAQFRQIGTYPSASFRLTQNISLTQPVAPIPNFSGDINGYGFRVSNLQCVTSGTVRASWIQTMTGLISDITFQGAMISGGGDRTGLIAVNQGVIYLVSVLSSNIYGSSSSVIGFIGGIVAENLAVMEDVTFTGSVNYGTNSVVGGVVGVNRSGAELKWAMLGESGQVQRMGGGGNYFTGGVVGINYGNLRKSAVVSTASVAGGANTGGVAGANAAGGLIEGAIMAGSVRANVVGTSLGGVVGYNQGSLRLAGAGTTASINGELTAEATLGGVAGYNTPEGVIEDSYSLATFSGAGANAAAGGLIGYQSGTARRNYTYGSLASFTYLGSFCGYRNANTLTSDSYFSSSHGPMTDSCAAGRTASQLQSQSTYVGWDFTTKWTLSTSYTPVHRWPFTYPN